MLQSAVRHALKELQRGLVSRDEALMFIDDCVQKFERGEPIPCSPLPAFPLWFRAWQWSHNEPKLKGGSA
jgi:hypothetical protein